MLTELHSVDDSLSIKTLTSFWDPNGHPGPELTPTIEGIGGARGLGNLVRPESHPEPRGFPVQWADPGIKPERLSVTMRSERY